MLRITRLTDYATVILGHMAQAPERLYSAKVLADELSLSGAELGGATVSKVLKILSGHHILVSSRGAEGGYKLAKPAHELTITAIIEAIEGPLAITECALSQHHCGQAKGCGVQTHWQKINQVIAKALDQMTLADLIQGQRS
jgi:FeS assembly SUF system regulator